MSRKWGLQTCLWLIRGDRLSDAPSLTLRTVPQRAGPKVPKHDLEASREES